MMASLPGRFGAAVARAGDAVGDELFPILVWLTVFGAARLSPSLILRLSVPVPQSMDFPTLLQGWRASAGGGRTVDELSTRLAHLIESTPSGSSSGSAGAALLPDAAAWTRTSHRISDSLFSVFTYPRRLLAYVLFQLSQRSALQASDAVQLSRSMAVKLLLRVVTGFTAIWVHPTGNMLYDTLITYLTTRIGSWSSGGTAGFVVGSGGVGRSPPPRLHSGWRDLLVASCVSTGVHFCLQTFWLEAMTSVGELRPFGRRPASPATRNDSASSFTRGVLSTLSRLGSKDTLYRLGRMALQPQRASPPPPTASSAPPVATPAASPDGPFRAAPPARVYLCGGNAFVFALSGLRFALYSDVQQLTTSTANCVTDAINLLRLAHQRNAAQGFQSSGDAMAVNSGRVWQPPVHLQDSSLATSSDVVLSPASSMQLLPIYMVNFAVGAGVGLLWREQALLIAAGRRIPLVRDVLGVLLPLPPPLLKLPEALQELSPECHTLLIYATGVVEVVGDDRVAPIVKQEGTAVHRSAPTLSSPASVRARVVVAQDLFCPIKRTLMCDPVQTVDGFTYDRDSIEEWLRVHDTAPLTNLHLGSVAVRVNWEARRQIESLVAQYAAAIRDAVA